MGGVAVFSRKPAISLKWGKTGPRLLLIINRKLHMHFRLVPKSVILDDFNGHVHSGSKCVRFSVPSVKIG